MSSRIPLIASLATAVLALLPASAFGAPTLGSRAVCAAATAGHARCLSFVATSAAGLPIAGPAADAPPATAYGPAQYHAAYSLPTSTAAGEPVQTIAIVDAFDHPFIESDLATYSAHFGLPACTTANGCFRKVDQLGLSAPLPAPDPTGGWELETALDVETVHAICQSCKILLVEANTNLLADLAAAVETAASLGANAISNSYGGDDAAPDPAYTQPGIAVVASAGDSDYGASYPAADANVVAVGGTTLTLAGSRYGSERVWNSAVDEGTGSGCSGFNSARPWQTATAGWSLTGCGTRRGIADVAADADPNTGAAVYDSFPYVLAPGHSSWWQVGGTSLSAPLIAGVYGLAGNASSTDDPASLAYRTKKGLHDVTQGDNVGSSGDCGTTMCHAHAGYDGPTGVGTPKGISSF